MYCLTVDELPHAALSVTAELLVHDSLTLVLFLADLLCCFVPQLVCRQLDVVAFYSGKHHDSVLYVLR